MTLWKRDVCTQLNVSCKEYGRIANLARYYKQKNRLADHKRIRPVEHKVLLEAGFFDEKRQEIEEEEPNLVVLESNIGFKFAGETPGGDGSTLLEHAKKRRHEQDLAAAQDLAAVQAMEPEQTPELPEPEPPDPVQPWADELRVVFQNDW